MKKHISRNDSLVVLYRNYSSVQLLEILENKEHYHTSAVFAAEIEIASRNISPDELNELYHKIEQDKKLENSPIKIIFRFIKEKASELIRKYNLIEKESPVKFVYLFGILVVLSLVYSLISNFKLYTYIFWESGEWDYNDLILFLPLAYLIAAIIFLFKFSRIGLSMFIAYFVFRIINSISSYIYELQLDEPSTEGLFGLFDSYIRKGFFYYFIEVLLFTFLLYVVNTKPFKLVFQIEKRALIIPVLLAIIFSVVLLVYQNIIL